MADFTRDQIEKLLSVKPTGVINELTNKDLSGLDLSGLDLSRCNFNGTKLRKANLSRAVLGGRNGGTIDNADLTGAKLIHADLHGVRGNGNTILDEADLTGATLVSAQLEGTYFENATLKDVDATRARFVGANLCRSDLSGATLNGASLAGADLTAATLLGINVDIRTDFTNTIVNECRVERYTLESLHHERTISRAGRIVMQTIDPVADMRMAYSGFLSTLHLVAVIMFVSPYVWFVCQKWLLSYAAIVGDSTTIVEALGWYVWTGGRQYVSASMHGSFVFFVLSMLYNVVRIRQVWKTKKLNHRA